MKVLHVLGLCAVTVLGLALEARAAMPPTAATPAATQQMILPSHGSNLFGVFYLAAGAGPHPTAIIFHGFPGFEQNLDIDLAYGTPDGVVPKSK